jgi:hypothetical protein
MRRWFFAVILALAAVLHSGSDPHNHAANRIPTLVRQQTLASPGSVKELRINVGDLLDPWADDVTVRA